jgi:hypothetical protein
MYKIFAMVTDDNDGSKEHYFSWASCELCHSNLGGDRYDYIAWDDKDDKWELSICVDCVMDVEGVGDES